MKKKIIKWTAIAISVVLLIIVTVIIWKGALEIRNRKPDWWEDTSNVYAKFELRGAEPGELIISYADSQNLSPYKPQEINTFTLKADGRDIRTMVLLDLRAEMHAGEEPLTTFEGGKSIKCLDKFDPSGMTWDHIIGGNLDHPGLFRVTYRLYRNLDDNGIGIDYITAFDIFINVN